MKDEGVSVTVACPGGIATTLFGLFREIEAVCRKNRGAGHSGAFCETGFEKDVPPKGPVYKRRIEPYFDCRRGFVA